MGLLSWFRRPRLDLDEEDFKDEIRAHLAMASEEKIADGADPREARYAALREFGNVTLTTEATRRVWMPSWLEAVRDLVNDIRYAIRTLAKNPMFALTIIGVLAVGIGLNATVFTMLKGFALSPIAGVNGSARLAVIVAETSTGRQVRVSYPDYQYLRDHDRAYEGLLGTIPADVHLGRGRGARQLWCELVSGNYFQVLGVGAQQGRTLLPSDEAGPGRQPVVVVSDGLWRREFAADPSIVGRTIEINNQRITVVGVADSTFHGTTVVYDVDVFVPITVGPQLGFTFGSTERTAAGILADRRATVFFPQGYLRRGVSRASAAAQTEALWATLSRARPIPEAAERVRVVPFWQLPSGAPTFILPTLGVLSAMALLVLLIACANIAGLVLVRGVSRRGEIAVRLALGARRTRIVRLLVVENLVLAAPGAFAGVLIASQAIPVFADYADWLAAPHRLFFNVEVDGLVIGFAALVACASALVFGFVPALQASRVDLVTVINEDASPRGAARSRLRTGLVVAQVAVSLMLLAGAGLVSRSVSAARGADPGFDATQVTSVALDLAQNGYDAPRGRVFVRQLLDAVRRDSRVDSATIAAVHPLNLLETRAQRVTVDGYDPQHGEDLAFASNIVGPDYFQTLRMPLVAGRGFEDRDDETAAPVLIVNRTFAERFWGDPSAAVGRRLRVGGGEWRTVVGVAADAKYGRVNEAPRPYFYLPFFQAHRSQLFLHTRGPGRIEELVAQASAHVTAIDPDLPVLSARPLTDSIRGAFIFLDLAVTMLLVFGTAGMALSAMGTYGLVAYAVKQSTHEIGIRMALGASRCAVVGQFVLRGLRLGALGAVLGIVAALGASRLIASVLFGVSATDPVSFVRALALVMAGVIIATIVPAWRAARTNPLTALRHQ